jgi:hypothetical protein
MLDAVVAQFSRRHDGGLRVLKARRSGEIAHPVPDRADIVKAG